MANNASNVSMGKPKIGGAVYNAPLGTTLPTAASATLANDYKCLGYVSTDGLVNDGSRSTEEIKAWGGDTVATLQTEKNDKFKLTLIEVLNIDVLKAVYGSDNVSGSLAEGIVLRSNASELPASVWVFDIVMTDGIQKRIVVPNAKISEIGEITYKDDEAVGYEITLTAMTGDITFSYDTHKEYILKPSGE